MGKTPELGIKVRVDPTIDSKLLKDSINEEIQKRNNADDTEKVKIEVDVNHFQNSLNTQLKDELKRVNKDLKYYLSNLTENASKLDDVVVNLFGNAEFGKKINEQFVAVNKTLEEFKQKLLNTNEIYEAAFSKTGLKYGLEFRSLVEDTQKKFASLTFDSTFDIKKDSLDELNVDFNELLKNLSTIKKAIKGFEEISDRPDFLKSLDLSKLSYDKLLEQTNEMTELIDTFLGERETLFKKGITKDNLPDLLDLGFDKEDNPIKSFEELLNFYDKFDKILKERRQYLSDISVPELIKDTNTKSDIESFTQNYADALSALVAQQNALNTAKRTTIGIEDQLITKTQSVRNAVSEELGYLRDFLKDVDTGAIQAKVADVQRMADEVKNAINVINQAESKRKNNKPQQTTSTPAEQKPSDENDIITYKEALESIKTGINNAKLDIVDFKVFLSEHKNDFEGMTKDIQAYVAALNEIDYAKLKEAMTSKATIHKEVAPETNVAPVDIPGRVKLENKDIAVPDKPVNISGKVTLSNEDVIVPTTPANIPGKVTLGKNDVIPPTEPIEILGKVTLGKDDIKTPDMPVELVGSISKISDDLLTKQASKKSQTKNVNLTGNLIVPKKNIEVPRTPIDLKGRISVAKADITVPKSPINLSGKIDLKKDNIKTPTQPVDVKGKITLTKDQVQVPKESASIKGKVVLSEKDVVAPINPVKIKGSITINKKDINLPDTPIAIKGKAPASSSKNSITTNKNLSFDDSKIVNEIQGVGSHLESIENVLGEQKKTLDKIATSAKNSKTFSSGTIKKTTNFDKLTQLYDNMSALEKKRSGLFKDSDAVALKEVNNQLSVTRKEINSLERDMKKSGENPLDSQIVNKAKNRAEFEAKNTDIDFKTKRIEFVRDSYIKVLREISKDQASLLNITDKNLESALQQNISRNLKYLEEARAELLSYNADADNAWKEIESAKSKISISDAEVVEASIKKEETRKAKELKDQQKLIDTIKKKLDRKLLEYKKFNFLSSEENKELNKYNYEVASDELADFLRQADREGLSNDKRIKDALKKYSLEKKAVIGYYKKVAAESTASLAPSEKEIISLTRKVGEYKTYIDRLSSTHKHGDRLDAAKQEYARLEDLVDIIKNVQKNNGTNKDTLVKNWAIKNNIEDVVSLGDAFDYITRKVVEFRNETSDLKNVKTLEDSVIRGRTVAINLASNLEKYLERNRRVESSEYGPQIRDIIDQLNTDDGWKNYPKIEENVARLKYFIHDAGLETETLSEKFEKLFGEHLSTALVMGALHQLQQSLQIMYQNVVDIDTAMAELRKVSNMTAQDMANYMEQAADQAARLGVSIASYVSSTAD